MSTLRAMATSSSAFLTPSPSTVPGTQYAKSILAERTDEEMEE